MRKMILLTALLTLVCINMHAQAPQAENMSQNPPSGYVLKLHPTTRLKAYEAIDSNEDGILDTFYYYGERGLRERQEIDSNYDGNVDIWIYFKSGVFIYKIVKDTNFDGKTDYEKIYGE